MSDTSRTSGSCCICASYDGCTYPKSAVRPSRSCDDFVGERPRERRESSTSVRQAEEMREGKEVLGLCRDCRRAATCTLSKPEGGVWHCDEYE